ncbi:hypothetical protein [Thomasclavelia cocleata]|uniref:hypothetical protein n=1 Tax=Thomasclavelia cocleata TaxID=69824 RepID=UPI00255AF409|nr:hypothetical protein [Thomasclavelia cocleata]
MLIGSYLPYDPNHENITSILHIILSSLGALSLIIIQILINRIILVDLIFYKKMTMIYRSLILMLGMFIIMFGSINSIVELFFTFTVLISLNEIEKYFK